MIDLDKASEAFQIFKFPQFILVRCQMRLDRPVMHDFMKVLSGELKGHVPDGPLKFIALDLQHRIELDPDFFKVCRGLLTYFKQAKLKFVALNCTNSTKDFLSQSGMSRFIIPINPAQLNDLQRPAQNTQPPKVEGDRASYLAKAWGDKVAEMISSLSQQQPPCQVIAGPAMMPVHLFAAFQVMASCNFQMDGENYYLSISLSASPQLQIFKNCSTYPQDTSVLTPENWLREFVNISVHKLLRKMSDLGHKVTCQAPGAIAYSGLAREGLGPAHSMTLDFTGTQFSCVAVPIRSEAAEQAASKVS